MASVIKAGNATDGVQVTSDNTGILELKTGTGAGTTALTLDASQNATVAGSATIQGLTVGRGAGAVATNTAVGASALAANTTGANNTAIGSGALDVNNANSNTAVGNNSLGANTTGSNNVAVGNNSGFLNTTGTNSTFIGDTSGYNTTGGLNTFIGSDAGYLVTTGAKNTILGRYSGNQGSLDIRTLSNQIVLSDGDGNPRVWVNNTGSARLGVNTTTSAAFVVGTSWIGNPVTVFGGDVDGSTISIGTSSTATYKIGNGNNRTALTLITDYNSGAFAFAYIGFSGNSIIYQNGTTFVAGAPASGQIGLTFNNTGSVVTITTGSSKSALCKVAVISVAVDM